MGSVLGEVAVSGPPELLLDDQRLLQQLEPPGQELVLDLQEIALAHVHFEGLIDDAEPMIILDVLPATITMSHNTYKR